MPVAKMIPAYYPPLNENKENLNRFFQVTGNKIIAINYEPQKETQENCFDLVEGQIFFKKKIRWLTDLQAKLLLYVFASGLKRIPTYSVI